MHAYPVFALMNTDFALTKNAIEDTVCYSGPDFKAMFAVDIPRVVQLVGFKTTSDGIDVVCLSDGVLSFPFGIPRDYRNLLSPYCFIQIKAFSKFPKRDRYQDGVMTSIFSLDGMEVLNTKRTGVIGSPVDLRKAKCNFDHPFQSFGTWDMGLKTGSDESGQGKWSRFTSGYNVACITKQPFNP
jgi:hypothetical protein